MSDSTGQTDGELYEATIDNLLEAVFNAGRIEAGQLVTSTVHKGAYIAIVPKEAKRDLAALMRRREIEAEKKGWGDGYLAGAKASGRQDD